ncbi:putative transposase of IS4/5 family DUF4096 [Deinococcus yavapaiensis KR-236]|uniref:Putative transposase of IS4/5 family DUF4096 n=1 Tax=Deinococcus yavapaiensis KR-236 TaxID=694435 RepID=A0A318S5W8_9DEIO|nr:putative transposase of IS4/5 family DUF4096 [Deinococcus yavapaiensis KR-236]
MPKPLVSDELWALIHPLLPPEPPKPNGGRPRVPDRDVLEGILVVLKTGTPWEHLPLELGYGSGMTCWRRRRDWHEAGVFTRLHHVLLDRMAHAEQLDWSRASLDSTSVPAARGARRPVRTQPTADGPAANVMSSSMVVERRWQS